MRMWLYGGRPLSQHNCRGTCCFIPCKQCH
uniref:Uncharacterized protein n=1 Tax=Anguilla anguilla TaxID=7936 RepID=A0A0E9ULT0_ANGAN